MELDYFERKYGRALKFEKREKDSEDMKIRDEVFDKPTLMALYELSNRGYVSYVNGVISTGKEANIFKGKDREENLIALKIYRISTSDYRNMLKYIEGDPRFTRIKRSRKEIVYTWAQKEFKNLKRAFDAKVRVPKPIVQSRNVLIMEFIGVNGTPAPRMKDYPPENPKIVYNLILDYLRRLYCDARLVHGDLSEYNVLITDEPVIIDMSQSLDVRHKMSHELLKKDIENLNKFFRKNRVDVIDSDEILKEILKCERFST
ncbi:MAG: serine protein kinase RIO [Candidatus Hydrothermarchaeota archaeon]